MAWRLDNCLCCLPLDCGALVYGVLSLIGNFLMTILMAMAAAAPKTDEIPYGYIIITLIASAIGTIFAIMLIVGIKKKIRCLIAPFMVICFFLIILSIVGCFFGSIVERISNAFGIVFYLYELLIIYSMFIKVEED